MILVDTSVWIDHFRNNNTNLRVLLERELVLTHPFVIGELACGSLTRRNQTLTDLRQLPTAVPAMHEEVLQLLDRRKIWSQGIGWIGAHLLASTLLSHSSLWTLDQRLRHAAANAAVGQYHPAP